MRSSVWVLSSCGMGITIHGIQWTRKYWRKPSSRALDGHLTLDKMINMICRSRPNSFGVMIYCSYCLTALFGLVLVCSSRSCLSQRAMTRVLDVESFMLLTTSDDWALDPYSFEEKAEKYRIPLISAEKRPWKKWAGKSTCLAFFKKIEPISEVIRA